MKKGLLIWIIIAIVIIGIIAAYFLLPKPTYITPPPINNNESPSSDGNNVPANSATPTTPTSTAQTYNIEIKGFAFNPAKLEIKTGDTVIWTNKDSVKHTVTSDSGTELDSPLFGQGETYIHKFEISGAYEYHCTPHPSMEGRIIVS